MRILLVEDDEALAEMLLQSLDSQHYIVDAVEDGQTGWEYAQSTDYDLLLMDVGLPLLDGITVCERLRSEGCSTPILLMTAKEASAERIRGLDAGADDYLTKPLDLGELHARVRALLRRGEIPSAPVLRLEGLCLDPSSCAVTYKDTPLKLTPKEYSLLELFLRNPSRVFGRGQIVDHLWTFDDPPLEESVKAHVKGLRQKLKKAGADGWIENVYGIGYRLSPKVGATDAAPPSESVDQEFARAREGLWQRYQDLMVQRLESLQAAAGAIASGTLSKELRQSAEGAAHKLAGVLGMFEREHETQLARQIEELLSPAGETAKVTALVEELSRRLNLSQGEPLATTPLSARLLLIDADLQLSEQLQKLAQSAGMNWHQTDLKAARTWLQTESPDLVVLDVEPWEDLAILPDLAARTPPVPVLVLAASGTLDERVKVARAGGSRFLVKPVTAAQVWDATTKLLQQRPGVAKVLVVDDDPAFLGALRPMLEPWGIQMIGLQEPRRFWEVLQSTAPDLIILDVEMPHLGGIELCQAVRTDPNWQSLPILFLTAHRDRSTIEQGFTAGADDYVTKPIVGPELLTRITNRIERTRLLQTLSTKDPLTGLDNQPHSYQKLERLLTEARAENQPLSLVLLQVVELRQITIAHGHEVANQVLQGWGRLLTSAHAQVVGYWGNGEFIIGLFGTKSEVSEYLSDPLKALRQQVYTSPDGSRWQANYHVAIAQYPGDGATIHSLYQAAAQG